MVKKKKEKVQRGPAEDCDCAVCIFAKSQAPGQPYDLSLCPKYVAKKKKQT